MISRIFKSVFYTTAVVLFIALAGSVIMSSYLMLESDSKALTTYTDNLAKSINNNPSQNLELLDIDLFRITLIHKDGLVYFDSKVKDRALENHSNRDEFIQASLTGRSQIYRYSATLDKRTVYRAVKLKSGDILRCSYTTDNIFSQTLTLSIHLLFILALAIVVSIYLATRLSKSIVDPINSLDLNNPLNNDFYEELSPLLVRIDTHQHKIKKLLNKVTASHSRMRAMTENISEGIIFLNKKCDVILINGRAKSIYKVGDECIGASILNISRSPLFCSIFEKKSELDNFSKEEEISNRFYNLIFNKVVEEDKLIGFAILLVDITKKKQLQEQRQEFSANVSHELKTPLQSIIGRAELIENGIVRPEDLQNFGAKIRTEGRALLNMINDIMFLSKVESGVKATTEGILLRALTTNLIEGLEPKAKEKNVSLNLECEDISISFVRRYYTEILNNLVSNAIKYNVKNGKVNVSVFKKDNVLNIVVKDTGLGIPLEDQTRIFERFFCVDRSHSNKDSTGLGLTIVKHIVEQSNGTITLVSEISKGSTFSVKIPL